MAMIPEDEIERIKRETDLAAVVRSRGIELQRQGGDFVGRCPFHHPDEHPSLHITPAKRLWRCVSCGATGNVIQFVQEFDGVSFRHAFELLKAALGAGGAALPVPPRTGAPLKKSTVPKLASPLALDADDLALMRQVVDYYQARLKENPAALEYLQKRGIANEEALARFKIGFVDRTLGLRVPQKNRAEGAALRARLTAMGIIRKTGHEHMRGRIVFPVPAFTPGAPDDWTVIGTIYGRAVGDVEKHERHLFLPGPIRGIWNAAALASPSVILTEGIIDALTFWCAGFHNVTTAYSAKTLPQELLDALLAAKTRQVLLAFNRDRAGDTGTDGAAAQLAAHGIECLRVMFPPGHDANSYALSVTPADKSLGLLLRTAQPIGEADLPRRRLSSRQSEATADGEGGSKPAVSSTIAPAPSSLAAKAAFEAAPVAPTSEEKREPEAARKENPPVTATPTESTTTNTTTAASMPPSAAVIVAKNEPEEVVLLVGDREYRVRGLAKNAGFESLKIALRVACGERWHLDTIDLCLARQRDGFINAAAAETALKPELLKRDLGHVLRKLEELQEARLRAALEPKKAEPALSAQEREAALALLRDPKLLDRILADFATCGLVGEETNKLVGYLAAVSRLLDRPLAVIVRATTAAGKTTLMDAILSTTPPECRVKYSALTGQALYYLGDADLRHKILAIVEEEGAEKASYALKLLQSEGELSIASTGKDPHTGRMVTQEYRVEGPVMIFLTTTAVDLDEELLNRCIVLTVDESREQTAAIHAAQRRAETLHGLREDEHRAAVLALHRTAQRLLRPLKVVNPYGEQLTFLDDRTRTRRDHKKYLTLIRTIALLHQHQRPVRTMIEHGKRIEYIEATREDIAAANRLAHDVLGRCLDDMPPQTRRLLALIQAMQRERAAKSPGRDGGLWRRRDLRAFTGWSDTALKVHLSRLVELEYVAAQRDPDHLQGLVYELMFDGDVTAHRPHLSGLIDVEKLCATHDYDQNRSGQNDDRSGGGQPPVSPRSGGGPGGETRDSSSENHAAEPQPGENTVHGDDEKDAAA